MRRAFRATIAAALSGILLAAGFVVLTVLTFSLPALAATANCTPSPGYTSCVQITYSGNFQNWTVPDDVTSVKARVWGAGGGGVDRGYFAANPGGGGGGYATGDLAVTPGTTLRIVVGQGGIAPMGGLTGGAATYGGGGAGGNSFNLGTAGYARGGSSGGGMSGVFTGTPADATAQIVAGGGGGSSPGANSTPPLLESGGGGGATGGASPGGAVWAGRGGTQTAGGAAATVSTYCIGGSSGSAFSGGEGMSVGILNPSPTSEGGGGGGGGYFGGGGGKCQAVLGQTAATINNSNGPGGGGSGYLSGSVTGGTLTAGANGTYSGNNGVGGAPAGTADPQYVSGTGQGGAVSPDSANGGNGLVVLEWNRSYQVSKSVTPTVATHGAVVTYTITVTNSSPTNYTAARPATFTYPCSRPHHLKTTCQVTTASGIALGRQRSAPVGASARKASGPRRLAAPGAAVRVVSRRVPHRLP